MRLGLLPSGSNTMREVDEKLDPDDVAALSYVELMSIVEETNRPPGGFGSIMTVRSLCNIGPEHNVLDVGCNTGYVAFKLSDLAKCRVVGIDLSPDMIVAANRKRKSRLDNARLSFQVGDALELSFEKDVFDLAICGGSLPFMEKPTIALSEMARVVRPGGFVCSVDFYYSVAPPIELLCELEGVLGFRIEPRGSAYWRDMFRRPGLELVVSEEHSLPSTAPELVEPFVVALLNPVSHKFSSAGFTVASRRLQDIFRIFVRNNDHLSYIINIAQKAEANDQPTLFA